jgi:hypothetical protein
VHCRHHLGRALPLVVAHQGQRSGRLRAAANALGLQAASSDRWTYPGSDIQPTRGFARLVPSPVGANPTRRLDRAPGLGAQLRDPHISALPKTNAIPGLTIDPRHASHGEAHSRLLPKQSACQRPLSFPRPQGCISEARELLAQARRLIEAQQSLAGLIDSRDRPRQGPPFAAGKDHLHPAGVRSSDMLLQLRACRLKGEQSRIRFGRLPTRSRRNPQK